MSMFPVEPPPLEEISDYAELFTKREKAKIRRRIQFARKRFPQIHWKVVTANLPAEVDSGLFGFWLLNVSSAGTNEKPGERNWTVLLVFLASGEIVVVPGYSAEVWLSGHDWTLLLRTLHARVRRKGYVSAIADFLDHAEELLHKSWSRMRSKVQKSSETADARLRKP